MAGKSKKKAFELVSLEECLEFVQQMEGITDNKESRQKIQDFAAPIVEKLMGGSVKESKEVNSADGSQ